MTLPDLVEHDLRALADAVAVARGRVRRIQRKQPGRHVRTGQHQRIGRAARHRRVPKSVTAAKLHAQSSPSSQTRRSAVAVRSSNRRVSSSTIAAAVAFATTASGPSSSIVNTPLPRLIEPCRCRRRHRSPSASAAAGRRSPMSASRCRRRWRCSSCQMLLSWVNVTSPVAGLS